MVSRKVSETVIVTCGVVALLMLSPSAPALGQGAEEEVGVGSEQAPLPDDLTGSYRVYTGAGEASSLEEVISAGATAEVVFLGESHNDRVGHRIQEEIFRRLAGAGSGTLTLSLEMFERDVQYILDEYVAGLISESHFRSSSRPWPFYESDYRPVVEFAKSEGISVVAANAPRRYVNRVSREGPAGLLDLSERARELLPPLPYAPPSEAYLEELRQVMSAHGGPPSEEESPEERPLEPDNGSYAQALWDASMAHSIATALMESPGGTVVHLVGSFHVRNGTGIPEHLELYRPGTRTVNVFVREATDIGTFDPEDAGAGDFVILTDERYVRDNSTGS